MIESNGLNTLGEESQVHPVSGIQFKGFKIPKWDLIKKICIDASMVVPQVHIVGWDVVIREDGLIELVEGNAAPDFDVMQSPLKVGVKYKLFAALNDVGIKKLPE